MMKVMMELLLILLASATVFAFNSSISTRDTFNDWGEKVKEFPECLTSSGATQEEVDQYFGFYKLSSTRNFRCYISCLYKALEFLSDDGLNVEEIVKGVPRLSYDEAAACIESVRNVSDDCEISYGFAYCIVHGKTYDFNEN
ncbi:hypothetical protein PPYR_14646 [Photinus pyralis]|uniref:Uncharacterized protein n=1 Tax=Photinus pyralis TaxID=7054 RepID=A0A5N4A5U9_PHOPY|nr:uncharacterized protein LOC116180955 [Photinus pyralis]KAB0792687.1 hypothetical protein PPYR_14646 [Photinus pyralis]